jgi:NADH:ubiquinone oxidoreductase subunit K
MKNVMILAAVLFVLGSVGMVLAQDEIPIPSVYNVIFASAMVQAIGSVVGFTQMLNNIAKLHGWAAVALAFAVSLGYSFAMYLSQGVAFCAVVAIAAFIPAALAYKATKAVGNAV